MFWLSLQLLSETVFILRRIQRDNIINVHRWSFLVRFSKNTQISNFMKIRLGVNELFHADRETTNMTKLIVPFRNFANAPKIYIYIYTQTHTLLAYFLTDPHTYS